VYGTWVRLGLTSVWYMQAKSVTLAPPLYVLRKMGGTVCTTKNGQGWDSFGAVFVTSVPN